jgi:propionyl-CoA carboxylase beta chain
VNIIHRSAIVEAGEKGAEVRADKVQEYRDLFANPWVAAERGYVDEVIEPSVTRRKLIASLRVLENKRDQNPPRKHGNIPL